MTAEEKKIIQMIRETGRKVVPPGGQVWLYGSHARGDAHEGSDWDLLILLNKTSITTDDEDNIAYPFVVEGWKNNTDVSPQLYTFDEWKARSFMPYYKNVEQDKQVLVR
ncbi:MAG: nucleotidyltransferase domain-containing protein [Bacteroidaceae bacterium]|nr:nucleotidyltransferase domain-containing protein [Bacteroidaceae bacterium]